MSTDPDAVYGRLSGAYGSNHFDIDGPLQAVLGYFLGSVPPLSSLGAFAGKELYETADYIDKVARPRLVTWDVRGDRVDSVWLDPSERRVLERLFKEFGVNKPPYRGGTWFEHFAAIYLVADPGIGCILTVTNQTAYALYKYGRKDQQRLVPSLIGEADAISYGATWFTELQGGSDLGANLVEAHQRGGEWHLDGDTKYFASNAGLADFALVTARPAGAPKGAKGLGLFLVPRLKASGERNFLVRRLKDKSGTVGVPTGEVEFRDTEASPIGEVTQGIYLTLENLMVSRLSNSVAALGIARKAFLEAYSYALVRQAFGKPLIKHPLVLRDLLDMELGIEGALVLTFKAIDQFQKSWHEIPPYDDEYHYARLLTHIAKNVSAETAAYVTKNAMELLGGLGFLNEFPVERLHREALITPIWEGPSNVQALDMLEAIAKKHAHEPLIRDLGMIEGHLTDNKELAESALARIKDTLRVLSSVDQDQAQFLAKEALNTFGHAIATILLADLGRKQGLTRFAECSRLYADRFMKAVDYPSDALAAAPKLLDISRIEKGEPVRH
jgi:alkylation response protein AidB-like acyl-CoA dehydrogenase